MRDFRYVLRDFRYADVRSALVPVGLSEGPRYTGIQILRAGRTKKSEQRNEKQSQKRTHTEKESIHNQKQSTRTKQDNTDRKTSIPTTKAEKQKLHPRKRNHGRLAPCFAADA